MMMDDLFSTSTEINSRPNSGPLLLQTVRFVCVALFGGRGVVGSSRLLSAGTLVKM